MPLHYSTNGRLVTTKTKSDEGDRWATLGLSTHIKPEGPKDRRTRRVKDHRRLYLGTQGLLELDCYGQGEPFWGQRLAKLRVHGTKGFREPRVQEVEGPRELSV